MYGFSLRLEARPGTKADRVDAQLDEPLGEAGGPDLVVLKRNVTEQRRHDGRDAQVQRAVHIAGERGERVDFLGLGGAGFVSRSRQHVQSDRAQQRRSVRKAAVQGGDADPGAAGDLVQRRVGTLLDKDLAGSGEHRS